MARSDDQLSKIFNRLTKKQRQAIADELNRRPMKRIYSITESKSSTPIVDPDHWFTDRSVVEAAVEAAEGTAKQLFQQISKDVGVAEATRIFRDLAGGGTHGAFVTPKERENNQNRELLFKYDNYKWPVQKLARHLASLNRLYGYALLGTRFGHSAESIDRQLRRLLKKQGLPPGRRGRPRKHNTPE